MPLIPASLVHPAMGTSFLLQEEQEEREWRGERRLPVSVNSCGVFILFIIPVTPVLRFTDRKMKGLARWGCLLRLHGVNNKACFTATDFTDVRGKASSCKFSRLQHRRKQRRRRPRSWTQSIKPPAIRATGPPAKCSPHFHLCMFHII